jgi:putative transcriptional regulator
VDETELAGSLLVAMPQLQDPNFRRAVVLLVEHDENGTFGLVLNRPTDISVASLCSSLDVDWAGEPNLEIQWGGPVQPNTGWVVFNENLALSGDEEGVAQLDDGVFFAGSLDVLKAIARTPPSDVIFFLGYAGWGPGQLENELATGAWLVAPMSVETVFDVDHDDMWLHVVRGLGVDPATLVSTSGIH